jgi:hypothetical protein
MPCERELPLPSWFAHHGIDKTPMKTLSELYDARFSVKYVCELAVRRDPTVAISYHPDFASRDIPPSLLVLN